MQVCAVARTSYHPGGNPGAFLSQSSTDATQFLWHLYWSRQETMDLPLGCFQGGAGHEAPAQVLMHQ